MFDLIEFRVLWDEMGWGGDTHFYRLEVVETGLIRSEEEVQISELIVLVSDMVSESKVRGWRVDTSSLLP